MARQPDALWLFGFLFRLLKYLDGVIHRGNRPGGAVLFDLLQLPAEGIQLLDRPAFSVQYHPEAAPGPTDAHYLFTAFARLMDGEPDYLNIDIAKDRLAGWTFASE